MPQRLFNSAKELKKSVWIHATPHRRLPTRPASLVAAYAFVSLDPYTFHAANPPSPQKLTASTQPKKPSATNRMKVYSLVWSRNCGPNIFLCTAVTLTAPVGRIVMKRKGSSVHMEIMLFSYLGEDVTYTGGDLGWPLHYSHHYIQGPQELHKEWRFLEDVLETDLSWFRCTEYCKGCEIKNKIMLRSMDIK